MTTTPAERLTAAADLLDKLAGEAAPSPWPVSDDNALGMPIIQLPYMVGFLKDHPHKRYEVAGPNDATTLYIATMHPEVGKALAVLLRREVQSLGGWHVDTDLIVVLADLILGGAA